MAGFFFAAVFLVTAFILYYYFGKEAVTKRRLRKYPHKKIIDFISGETGRIIGEVIVTKNSLKAPLSGRACAYYHIIVNQRNGKQLIEIINEEQGENLLIYDGSAYALIKTKGAKTHILPDANYNSGFLNNPNEIMKTYLKKHQIKPENMLGMNKTFEYKEGVLEKKEIISVSGIGTWEDSSKYKLEISTEKVLVIEGNDEHIVTLTDSPGLAKADI